jgi:hypothetical protein
MNQLKIKRDWTTFHSPAHGRTATIRIIRPLKLMCFIATLLGIQGAVPLGAAVSLISVEHRVWGDAGQSPTNSYDETGSGSLSRNVSNTSLTGVGYYASSSAADWSVEAYRAGDAFYCNGFAQNTYVFSPLGRQLTISLGGNIGIWWFENDARMRLTDLSTDSIVSTYQSPSYFSPQSPFPSGDDMVNYAINWNETLEVNPEHQYELILFVGAHRGEGGPGSAALNLTLAPEPGTSLLVGMAVLLTCARRQRPAQPTSRRASAIFKRIACQAGRAPAMTPRATASVAPMARSFPGM